MPAHHVFDVPRNVEKPRLSREESRNHLFVRRVEARRHRRASRQRFVSEAQAWEAAHVGLLEGKRSALGERKRLQMSQREPIRIRERERDRNCHVRRGHLGDH